MEKINYFFSYVDLFGFTIGLVIGMSFFFVHRAICKSCYFKKKIEE